MQEDLIHELLVKLQRGNTQAAAAIAALLGHQFYACARSKYQLSHEDADDVVQTTLKNIIERISTYHTEHPGGLHWVWTIFRNAVIDLFRARKHYTTELTENLIENGPLDEDISANPEMYLEHWELSSILAQALALLPEAERKDLLRGRGRAGPKRKSLELAEQHLQKIFASLY
jgi:RNA polymerase sigma factor (sigma-70 family)